MSQALKIQKTIHAPIARVYEAFLSPIDLTQWYYASEGWTTPYAEVDAKPGGRLKIAFQDPKGKNTFDYEGNFVLLEAPKRIVYKLDDNRKVSIRLVEVGQRKTRIIETFDSEDVMPIRAQLTGWKSILNHLEDYLKTQI
ncbi:MAG TPA: SRPBCC domain-containing protein [Anaerolineaceae bacterium]|nr:SRPBCC domain-containing protein [Anaerolineaceae bacterium]